MSRSNNTSGGIGISGVLGIVFIVLKLTSVIAWSWWWVLAPFWIPVIIILILLFVVALFRPSEFR